MRSGPQCGHRGHAGPGQDLVGGQLDHEPVGEGRDRSDDDRSGPVEQECRGPDDDEVEEREDRLGPARGVDEHAHQAEVPEDLDVGLQPRRQEPPDRPVEEGQDEGRGAQPVEVGDVDVSVRDRSGRRAPCTRIADSRIRKKTATRIAVSQRSERRRDSSMGESRGSRVKRQGPDRSPRPGYRTLVRSTLDSRPASYPILLISVNIGRYIAMTIPPMTTPRMKIMTGSSSLTSPATAMSTSSS